MLVTTCPRCGKPTPARLASPDEIECAACGYDGPPSPEATPVLAAAREFLLGRDARGRQLTETRARALSQNAPLLFALLFVLATFPCTYAFATTLPTLLNWSGRSETYGGAVLATLALVGIWIYGIQAFFRVKRVQDQLRQACAALPPTRQGDPARCRVCGGPLPAGDAVVRCPFCATDNFADPRVISKLEERQSHDAAEYEFAVARAETLTQSVTFEEQKRALVRAVVIPILAIWPMSVLTQILLRIELPTNGRARYAFTMTRDGECVELATKEPGFVLSALVDKRVHVHVGNNRFRGVVDRVYGSVLGNIVVVDDERGFPSRVDPRTLCLIVPAPLSAPKATTVFAVDDQLIYFPDLGGIFSAPIPNPAAGGLDVALQTQAPLAMTTRGGTLFFEDGTQLFRAENSSHLPSFVGRIPQGSMSLVTASRAPSKTIFAFVASPPTIYAFDPASSSPSPKKIPAAIESINATASDGDDVFVAGLDAQGPAVFVAHGERAAEKWLPAGCEAIAVDASALYCGGNGSITSFDRNAGTPHVIFELPPQVGKVPEDENINAIAVDASDVYFSYDRTSTRATNGFIGKVAKGGGAAHVIAEGLPRLGTHLEVTTASIITTTSGDVSASEGGGVATAEGHKNEELTTIDPTPTSDDAIVVLSK